MRIALIMLFSMAVAGSGGRRRDGLEEWLRARFEREQVSLGGKAVAARIAAEMRCRPSAKRPGASTTRWQGIMIGIGLQPLAWPTERALPPATCAMSM